MNLQRFFLGLFSAMGFMLLLIAALSYLIFQNKQSLVTSSELRHQSHILANELLNSSDDLTRLVRTYVVTGDPKFEQQFWEVLAIRNGEIPRPQNYHSIYWDFKAIDVELMSQTQEKIALNELMKQAAFTEQEFALLHQAHLNSDALVKLEAIAMNAVKGLFQDADGEFTIEDKPDLEFARQLVHGEEYHQTKVKIMEPIYDFFKMLDQRTKAEVEQYINISYTYLYILITLVVLLLILISFSYFGIAGIQRSEEELRLKEEFLRLIMDNIPQLIFWKDAQLCYLGCNRAVADMNNLASVQQVVGKTDYDLVWAEFADDYRADDRDVMDSNQAKLKISEKIRTATHAERWIETNKIPLHDSKGNVIGVLGTVEDITERKQAEAVLEQYNQRLKNEVEAQTEALAAQSEELITVNEELQLQARETAEKNQLLEQEIEVRRKVETELRQAKEAADVASQAKSTFLANMSHELRTPLNGILGYAQILIRDTGLNQQQQHGIEVIQRSGDYLLTLINDILDLAKIEANRIELYETDIYFEDFMQSIVELFKIRAEQKGINFIYEPLTSLPIGVRADEKRLRQVLLNLLGNAVKFTEVGGVSLKVSHEQKWIQFHIEDTGLGIAKQDIKEIFQPFHQVGDVSYKATGTGLGLSITQRIVQMMRGEIHVSSELGKGSTFWVILELPEVSNLVKPSRMESKHFIVGYESHEVSPKTILVVDDKWENRSVMTHLLTPLGFNVVEAENGQIGIDKAIILQADIILTDLVMPVLDGFEMVRRLRKRPEFTETPIIAVSASVFDMNHQQSIDAGCSAFIPKPFKAEELLSLLHKFLSIKWIYDTETPKYPPVEWVETKIEKELLDSSAIPLSTEQAGHIYEFTKQGDVSGIMDYCDELMQQDVRLTPFTQQIRQLASEFEDDKICKLIQPLL